jgi:four helix bundle protein
MYKSFEEMPVWKEAFELANSVYNLADGFPKTETYALADQLRRSSVSVHANIAESFGRQHTLDKINFLYNSRGSLCETKSHLLFALSRNYITQGNYIILEEKIGNILNSINALIKTLHKKHIK